MALLLIWYIWIVLYASAPVTYGSPVGAEAAAYLLHFFLGQVLLFLLHAPLLSHLLLIEVWDD